MVAILDRKEQENFIGLLSAMGVGNGNEAADFVINFSSKQVFFCCCSINLTFFYLNFFSIHIFGRSILLVTKKNSERIWLDYLEMFVVAMVQM
jgi:hypothetical protein